MGYSTTFKGELKFTTELTEQQIAKLYTFLGEDCREHPEWSDDFGLTYIDLKFTKDFSGLEWDGSEKTYDLHEKVNLLIREMQREYPTFMLSGSLLAQGEDVDDRWLLSIDDCVAVHKEIAVKGEKVKCPHCGNHFIVETE